MISGAEVSQSGMFDFKIYPVDKVEISAGKGLNKKGLLVAMAGTEAPELLAFLEKVLQAVGYDLQEDALSIWVTSAEPFWFKGLDQAAGFSHAIFFGIPPAQAGLNLQAQLYQPVSIADKTFLFADNLQKIQENPPLKRPLWEALKTIFK